MTSGESLNDTTITTPQEGDQWINDCEDAGADCGQYAGEGV